MATHVNRPLKYTEGSCRDLISSEFVARHPKYGELRGSMDADYLHAQSAEAVKHFNTHVHPENYEE